jgi:molybdate transport system substrate-binding protein
MIAKSFLNLLRTTVLPCLAIVSSSVPCVLRADENANASKEVMVFAAASLTDVLNELAASFEKAQGVKVVYNFAGSNTLAQQIVASPNKADVFLSASEKWMDTVQKAGAVADKTRKSMLTNSLVVVAHPDSAYAMKIPEDLATMEYKFLALGNPDAVPAGKYSKEWLSGIKYGQGTLWDAVKDRVSPTPDVRAALAQVEGRDNIIGIVYKTDYASAGGKVRVIFEIQDKALGISYPGAVMKEAPHPELAKAFMDYLSSPEAKGVFRKYGFGVIE